MAESDLCLSYARAADFKLIAHVYNTWVYALAARFGIPEEARSRPPTTDTFSLEHTQEDPYVPLPYERMDLCLYAHDQRVSAIEVADAIGVAPAQVERGCRDIASKRRATARLHATPLLVEPVDLV